MKIENGVIVVNIDFINGWIKGGDEFLYYCKDMNDDYHFGSIRGNDFQGKWF